VVAYVDSSVLLDTLLEEGSALIDHIWAGGPVYSSELLSIECRRTVLRERLGRKIDDEGLLDAFDRISLVLGRIHLVELSSRIKQRAGEAFPIHVKTLDALHLSTALAVKAEFEEETVVFSRDQGMNRCAKLLGMSAPWYS
jgi:predicted nucleic acid-binding protein